MFDCFSLWLNNDVQIGESDIFLSIFLLAVGVVKFINSEKATQFCEISNLLFEKKGGDFAKFVAFSEYMNFNRQHHGQTIHPT